MNIFIIGNGESRKDFDLKQLDKSGNLIVGCNAIYRNFSQLNKVKDSKDIIYRDFKPSVLIAVDQGILTEIKEKCDTSSIIFIRRNRTGSNLKDCELIVENYKKVETRENVEVIKQEKVYMDNGWAAGPTALFAMLDIIIPYHFFIKSVYLIGFDLSRLDNGKGSSMYKGTDNYIRNNSAGATHDTSAKQLARCFSMFIYMDFKRVIDTNHFPTIWKNVKNVKNITYKEMLNEI